VFAPINPSESYRAERDILYVNGVWLDFEDGDLTHQTFADIFPSLRIIAFNSYRSTNAKPRFRTYIPTSGIMTPDVYRTITSEMMRVVMGRGYRLDKQDASKPDQLAHGIDRKALPPTSLFYMPCKAADPKGSFFKDYHGDGREPLCPSQWVTHAILPDQRKFEVTAAAVTRPVDENRIEAALARWRSEGITPEQGNREFWCLAVQLKAAGMPYDQIERTLQEEASVANTPKDRLKDIRGIMKRLRR
jgi:hypothetical protein